jgi:hypothetical protein
MAPKKKLDRDKAAQGPKARKGEQLQLLEVGPTNLKAIRPRLAAYKEAMEERVKWLATEVKEKQAVLELVHKGGMKRLENGNIEFVCDGLLIKITPVDEKIKIGKERQAKVPKD